MIAPADLEVGMRVTVVPWRGHRSYWCGHSGEVVTVHARNEHLQDIRYFTPDVRVQLDGWPRPMGFWVQELALEDVS